MGFNIEFDWISRPCSILRKVFVKLPEGMTTRTRIIDFQMIFLMVIDDRVIWGTSGDPFGGPVRGTRSGEPTDNKHGNHHSQDHLDSSYCSSMFWGSILFLALVVVWSCNITLTPNCYDI